MHNSFSTLMVSSAGNEQQLSAAHKQGGSGNNLEVSVNTLVALLTHHKCLAFLLLARHEHPGALDSLSLSY
jgi:hypothetical protein